MKPLRIAFLTPEFLSECDSRGGLANYVNRISRALSELGHTVEVFVVSNQPNQTLDWHGVAVHRVRSAACQPTARTLLLASKFAGSRQLPLGKIIGLVSEARELGAALERRHRQAPFDFVQSSDYRAAGLFVKRRPNRPHLARCSAAMDLWQRADERGGFYLNAFARLERASVRRAEIVYAPSRFIADYFTKQHRIAARVVRPPGFLLFSNGSPPPIPLPPKFLMHFGQLATRKGTRWLAETLPLVWAESPDFRMVWAGSGREVEVSEWKQSWGDGHDRVTMVNDLPKAELYSILSRAAATVVPSLVDNLPNTAIESLLLGVPVVGSAGASIDELVDHERNGLLVPINDRQRLAAALLRVWRGEVPWSAGDLPLSDVFDEMTPNYAAHRVIELAEEVRRRGKRAAAR